ncbi:MAG: cation diffusion facilitator family transporter [Candidatus Izemoplasmatales bacterium]|jgi:cation diffusion facilitator family transporter|nr:cation diffusion facilitator family transporter [Candidatus Izemoplasmatales bacterium]
MKAREEKIIKSNTILTIIANFFLAVIKLIGGIIGLSSVLITDAINSISDIATNLVVFISAKFSKKDKDKDHPYGHDKYDSMVSIFLGMALIITAFEVGKSAFTTLYNLIFNDAVIAKPAWYTIVIVAVTLIVKELLYRKTKVDAKKANSQALLAQAWDHRSDTLTSIGALIGILGAMFGIGYLDPIASIFILIFILRLGFKIIKTGVSQVVDASADDEQISDLKKIVLGFNEVISIDEIKTRLFGVKYYVDLEISLDGSLSLEEAHEISERIHDKIEDELPDVKHCMIHVNPGKEKK